MRLWGQLERVDSVSKYDVYRDAEGNPVTLTEDQVNAVIHALYVRRDVAAETDPESQQSGEGAYLLSKSRLLGRMLIDGRPPLDDPPEYFMGARGYHLAEPDLHHFYMNGWPE